MTQPEQLARLRAVVGYLGEREQHAWWQSSFLAPTSPAFLAPVFGRTQVLAQVNGVTRAASMVHDERIGVGQVYHLFRLPEDLEQGIHQALYAAGLCEQIIGLIAREEPAMAYLSQSRSSLDDTGVGPMRVGGAKDLREPGLWRDVAAQYAYAFKNNVQVFPYFTDIT